MQALNPYFSVYFIQSHKNVSKPSFSWFWNNKGLSKISVNRAQNVPATSEWNIPVRGRRTALCLFHLCVCLCVRSGTSQGCGSCYLEALTGLTLRFHGWLGRVLVWVIFCVCAPQKEASAAFRSVEERDTDRLFPPSFLGVAIYTIELQQDKQNGNCVQSVAT